MSMSLSVCDFVCFVLCFFTHSCCFGVINDDDDDSSDTQIDNAKSLSSASTAPLYMVHALSWHQWTKITVIRAQAYKQNKLYGL